MRHRLGGTAQRLLRRRLAGPSTSPWPSASRSSRTPGSRAWCRIRSPATGPLPETTAPARFSLLGPAYAKKYGVDEAELKDVLTRIAWKNHYNGARNSRAQFRKEVSKDAIAKAAPIAGHARRLRLLRCVGRVGGRHRGAGRGRPPLHRQPLVRQGPVVRRRPGPRQHRPGLRLHDLPGGGCRRYRRLRPGRRDRSPCPSWPWPRCTTASRRPSWS